MILKFDHIALSCKRKDLEKVLVFFSEYKRVFFEKNLPNLSIKKQFMSTWKKNHDIVLLNKESCLPVEITAYDDICKGGKFDINNGVINVFTDNIQETEIFYQSIGFKYRNNLMELKTILDNKPVLLTVTEAAIKETMNTYIDSEGYCCLAFLTNSTEKERERLIRHGVKTTEIQKLRINGKDMDIFFAYNEYGDICELISLDLDNNSGGIYGHN